MYKLVIKEPETNNLKVQTDKPTKLVVDNSFAGLRGGGEGTVKSVNYIEPDLFGNINTFVLQEPEVPIENLIFLESLGNVEQFYFQDSENETEFSGEEDYSIQTMSENNYVEEDYTLPEEKEPQIDESNYTNENYSIEEVEENYFHY